MTLKNAWPTTLEDVSLTLLRQAFRLRQQTEQISPHLRVLNTNIKYQTRKHPQQTRKTSHQRGCSQCTALIYTHQNCLFFFFFSSEKRQFLLNHSHSHLVLHTFIPRHQKVQTQCVGSRLVAVAVADGVPLEIGVSELGREGVDDVRAVVVDPAAAVGLRELSCTADVKGFKRDAIAFNKPPH